MWKKFLYKYFDVEYKFKINRPKYLFLWCLFFSDKMGSKKGYMEMLKSFFLATLWKRPRWITIILLGQTARMFKKNRIGIRQKKSHWYWSSSTNHFAGDKSSCKKKEYLDLNASKLEKLPSLPNYFLQQSSPWCLNNNFFYLKKK